jgi:hypothetical protein
MIKFAHFVDPQRRIINILDHGQNLHTVDGGPKTGGCNALVTLLISRESEQDNVFSEGFPSGKAEVVGIKVRREAKLLVLRLMGR